MVAGQIGFFWALMIIFASTFSGIAILRYRGPRHWAKFRGALNERRPPAREAFNGFMITTGAVLLIIPGYLTSVLALFLLFPPTRYLVGGVANDAGKASDAKGPPSGPGQLPSPESPTRN